MNIQRPNWVKQYINFGFSENWFDEVIEKHDEELINQLSQELNPINYYKLNPLDIENDSEILKQINIPQDYKLPEILLLILDLLNQFGKHSPKSDSQIYELYNFMNIYKISFDEFYTFIRRLQYTNIPQTKSYITLEKTLQHYILNTIPVKKSVWVVPYKNGKIKVRVIDLNTEDDTIIHDNKIYVEIIDIIEDIDMEYLTQGSKILLKPYAFNNGIQEL